METSPIQNNEAEIASIGSQVAHLMISVRKREGEFADIELSADKEVRTIEHGWEDLSHRYPKYNHQIDQFKHVIVPYLRFGPRVVVSAFSQLEGITDSMTRYLIERILEIRISGQKELHLPENDRPILNQEVVLLEANRLEQELTAAGVYSGDSSTLSFTDIIGSVLRGDLIIAPEAPPSLLGLIA